MKTIKFLLFLFVLTHSYVAYCQDTIGGYIQSRCLQFVMPLDKMPEPELYVVGDQLIILGQIQANCAGTHIAIVNRNVDSLFITTKDTGLLANCVCVYTFKLSVYLTPKTKTLVFNKVAYGLESIAKLSLATDTLSSIFTSNCKPMGSPFPTPYFERQGDSIRITGMMGANCTGTHLAIVNRRNDSVFVATKDTGLLATCSCVYDYKLKFRLSPFDTVVVINQMAYNLNRLSSGVDEPIEAANEIDAFYDPSMESLRIDQKSGPKLIFVSIYDRSGVLQLTVANDRTLIDLSDFPLGLYVLDFVLADKRHLTRKIIKSK